MTAEKRAAPEERVDGDSADATPPVHHASSQDAADAEEEDIGPMPAPAAPAPRTKKRKELAHEETFLEQLPCAEMYERSFMHRDVMFGVVTTCTDFIITASMDGHVKFWKKTERGVEFVKNYRAHLGAISGMAVSHNGLLLATVSPQDRSLKVFDIINFDMINIVQLNFEPAAVCWMGRQEMTAQALVAVSDAASPAIKVYDGKDSSSDAVRVIDSMHAHPVHLLQYNVKYNCMVSCDMRGMLECWSADEADELRLPDTLNWQFKSDTDLYEYAKPSACPTSLQFSPNMENFVTYSQQDQQVRIFRITDGKMIRKYDESTETLTTSYQSGTGQSVAHLDSMEFGRRVALQKELDASSQCASINAVFDESGNFVLYPTLVGIKVVNIVSNKVSRLIGRGENIRFLNIALYQGTPKKKVAVTLAMAASENPALQKLDTVDPILVCTAFKKNRFYLFTTREPETDQSASSRDVFNEKPSREEQAVATQPGKAALGSVAILRTTVGDIVLKLYPEQTPKTVENFVTHARNNYYAGHIFHRVIRGFMIQTGDPNGNGTGGESIWGHEFEDEFHKDLRHDKPYTLSMANAGPNTNGSQFFITTVPTPWLDNKHTVFGRVTGGIDVVQRIEHTRCSKIDKPVEDIKIINIEIR